MKLLIRILIFLSISILLIECMSSEKVTGGLQMAIVNSKVNAWLNLMPGTSPGTFHLVGEITIENKSDGDIEDIKLDSVSIYSKTGEIYSIVPYFKPKLKGQDFSILLLKHTATIFLSCPVTNAMLYISQAWCLMRL